MTTFLGEGMANSSQKYPYVCHAELNAIFDQPGTSRQAAAACALFLQRGRQGHQPAGIKGSSVLI